ncbi:hypothetical protein [Gloeothece citriformis]|nr:hypothetical protein [Gloeothece citriformis]
MAEWLNGLILYSLLAPSARIEMHYGTSLYIHWTVAIAQRHFVMAQ